MTPQQINETAARYGNEFALHAQNILAPDSFEDIDFCICDTCGQPFPKTEGIHGQDTEYCSKSCQNNYPH